MSIYTMYSADQNCSPFWDTWPKLEVLTRKKNPVFHLVHDTDTIFHDQSIKDETPLTIKWFHDKFDGSHYYSPNLFYFQFLGKHEPFPVNQLEIYTGLKLSKISSLLNISVEVLYEKFGSYDKLALLGKGKYQNGFRIAAGVKVSECTEQIEELFRCIQDNMLQFIVTQEQKNNLTAILSEWKLEVDTIIASNPDIVLANLFSLLMESKFNGKVSFSSCFDYFNLLPQNKDRFCFFLSFLREYHKHAQYYNEALCRNNSSITPLDISKGELPFYAIRMIDGRLLRFPLYLHGHQLICQEKFVNLTQNTWEDILNWCQQVGIASIVGKAIPLMMQLRHKEYGGVIAMPKLGSPYMAIVDTYAELLNTQEMYPEIKGVSLVDFQVFKALHNADFSFKLPIFLQEVFKKEVIHCQDFVVQLEVHINESNRVLDLCKQNMEARKSIMKEYYPSLVLELSLLEKERQSQGYLLASLSKQSKEYQQKLEQFIQIKEKHKIKSSEYVYKLCHLLFTNWHVSQLNYFNNRGSIELWAKTLGGLDFYQSIIDHAIVQD